MQTPLFPAIHSVGIGKGVPAELRLLYARFLLFAVVFQKAEYVARKKRNGHKIAKGEKAHAYVYDCPRGAQAAYGAVGDAQRNAGPEQWHHPFP